MDEVRVLVTGGAGFVGSHVVEHLLERGDEPVVVDDLSTGDPASLPAGTAFVRADIADMSGLSSALQGERFDSVVHAAAEASVVRSIADPSHSERVNVEGTANVLALARERGARRFVFFSTGGAIYGETPSCATESTPLRPISPYGRHKLQAERLVRDSRLPHAILRPGNIYGPRQRGDLEAGVVAIFLERYRAGRELVVFGDGSAQRDYVYVTDVARTVGVALERGDDGTWNLGSGVATSVGELIDALRRYLGEPQGGVRHGPPRAGELQRSCLDSTKAAREGIWQPRYSLEAGLQALLAFEPRPTGRATYPGAREQ